MSTSNKAAVLKEAKAQITVEQRPIPTPQAGEILVKNSALATNPVDFKIQDYGFFVTEYPNVLGSDVAGTVEAVGSGVKHFKKGDRVAGFAGVIRTNNIDDGAFQQYCILREHCAAKLPQGMSFEEGATLPMSVATAGGGLWTKLNVPKPDQGKQSGGFLVWGASSSVGACVVQMAAQLGFTVFAVCSPHNQEDVKKLGADVVFDYKNKDVVKNIIDRAESGQTPIKYAFDAISEHGSAPLCVEVLEGLKGGKLCLTLPYPQDAKKPENVEISNTGAFAIVEDMKDFGAWLFNEWLEGVLASGSYKIYPTIQRMEGGIEGVQNALNVHKKGVSGKKLVLPL